MGPSAEFSQADLVGNWDAEALEADIYGVNGEEQDSTFAVSFLEGTARTSTHIYGDGRFVDAQGEGFWHLNGDTLIVRSGEGGRAEVRYGCRKKGNRLWLTSRVDWDGDGAADDVIKLTLRRP